MDRVTSLLKHVVSLIGCVFILEYQISYAENRAHIWTELTTYQWMLEKSVKWTGFTTTRIDFSEDKLIFWAYKHSIHHQPVKGFLWGPSYAFVMLNSGEEKLKPEHRPDMQILFWHSQHKTKLTLRARLEWRFLESEDYRGKFRFRTLISLTHRWFYIFQDWFYDFKSSMYNQIRSSIGIQISLTASVNAKVGYLIQTLKKSNGWNHNHTLRLALVINSDAP